MQLMQLNIDVLTIITTLLGTFNLRAFMKTCKLARVIGIRTFVANVRIDLDHLRNCIDFMLLPINRAELAPLVKHLDIRNRNDYSWTMQEKNKFLPDLEQIARSSATASDIAALLTHLRNLGGLEVAGIDSLLTHSNGILADSIVRLPSLSSIRLHAPGEACRSLMQRLKHITEVTISDDAYPNKVWSPAGLLQIVAGNTLLSSMTLNSIGLETNVALPMGTLPSVKYLEFFSVSANLDTLCRIFPGMQKFSIEDCDLYLEDEQTVAERHIDWIITDWISLEEVSMVCTARFLEVHISVSSDVDDDNLEYLARVDSLVLSLDLPHGSSHHQLLVGLGAKLPPKLQCLDLNLYAFDPTPYGQDGLHFLSDFRTSSPLKLIHVMLEDVDEVPATEAFFESLMEGTFLLALAEAVPSLQFVTVGWFYEGMDLRCWSISRSDTGNIAINPVGTLEGGAIKSASFKLSR